ncbi:hypothetical protein GCM10012278_85480 [Nonomuraea glycinis]|uniref:Uncharacterized protein n=1 Tax=Nonomuraea glycinis TaxID=2047744 RepID=A0A918AFH3_9ACTN|nr:hypothetical protein GCM10012278_85480 [Nonomuraea glycinis]
MKACEPIRGRTGTWLREFPGAERSVTEAREWARGLLGERIAAPVLDDVVLLLSEWSPMRSRIRTRDARRTVG